MRKLEVVTWQEELTQSLEVMKGICNNPLMQLGCYIQTVSWSDHGPVREMHAGMNSHIKEAASRIRLSKLMARL